MEREDLFSTISEHFDEVIGRLTERGKVLWRELEVLHPADIADFLAELDDESAKDLFMAFPSELRLDVFKELSDSRKALYLSYLDDKQLHFILMRLSVDELTEFFDELSDVELERYLKLLQKKDREQIVSVLQFEPESAGRHMDVSVLALMSDFTVENSIQLIRRLQPDQELHRRIFVTDRDGILQGYILLEDLVLKLPSDRLSAFLRKNDLVVHSDEDREAVALKMVRYNTFIAPVIGPNGLFLGIIPAEELVDIIEKESSEDIYRMATMSPIKESYFETSFWKLFGQRSSILILLLFVQSISTSIVTHYQTVLASFLMLFTTMLISTGGNTSSQTSALAIKGLATGEIDTQNYTRFIKREFSMSFVLGIVLSVFSFVRVYLWHQNLWGALAVSISLAAIVMISMLLGSIIPLALKGLNIDPAHSAGPLLATLMDIIGLLVFCMISDGILGYFEVVC